MDRDQGERLRDSRLGRGLLVVVLVGVATGLWNLTLNPYDGGTGRPCDRPVEVAFADREPIRADQRDEHFELRTVDQICQDELWSWGFVTRGLTAPVGAVLVAAGVLYVWRGRPNTPMSE